MFQKSVLNSIKQDESLVALRWAEYQKFLAKVEYIKTVKEEKYQDGFLKDIFENCLGYTLDMTDPSNFNLEREKKNETDGKKADGVIYVDKKIVGVIELKAQDTKNLDKIEAQAFNYHASHSNSKYIIISNFDELRFYIDKKTAYEKFSLFNLDYEEFKKLHLLISYESIKTDIPLKLKEKTSNFEQNISKELYKDFSVFRNHLFENIVKNNENIDKSTLLRLTQKLCDRIIFILFAEDRGLLTPNIIKQIRERHEQDVFGNPMYGYYKIYFDAINSGNEKLGIPKYNGGLFSKDEILDSLIIEDSFLDMEAQKLSDYNFESEISVNILGHIFEQSLTDLEELQANIENTDFDKTKSKRKKDGVFYTPEYITKYIVENTLGKMCNDKREELNLSNITAPVNPKKLTKVEQQTKDNILIYKDWLFNLKILDPACGSGAFLNQALEYLIKEHKQLQYDLALMGDLFSSYTVEESVLEHNLYGVDINEDAVEIAKLSLWLRTAQKGRTLTNLNDKIICANSLLEMPFSENSFDVVIGNPPYVQLQSMIEMSKTLKNSNYDTFESTGDLYVLFYELGNRLLKQNGLLGYITSNKWMRAKYGKSLRKYLAENTSIKVLIDLGKNIFEDATVDSNILIFTKEKVTNHDCIALDLSSETKLTDFGDYMQNTININKFTDENWILNNPIEQQIQDKIDKVGVSLKDWKLNINRGILTGFNEAFIIDSAKKEELIAKDKKSAEIIKPLLRGRDIQRYYPDFADQYVIATFPALGVNINEYSAIKEHLESFGKAIEQSGEKGSRKKTNNKWFETQDTVGFFKEFEKELIIWKRIGSILRFSLGEYYCLDSTCILSSEYNKYLLCVFNSKMGHYLMKNSPKTGTGDLLVSVQAIEPLKIPVINNQDLFIQKADLMIELNKKSQETKQNFYNELKLEKLTNKLQKFEELEFDDFIKEYTKSKKIKFADKLEERNFKNDWKALFENDKKEVIEIQSQINQTDKEIDQMVYKLYDLTEDEIKIVESV
ncbi:MAG: Eco57I restriction-modification methylase domain-containing protein [Candidatus Paceibacteria bacterium]